MQEENSEKWVKGEEGLYRKFVFKNFVEAFGFMTEVAIWAEKMNHHPTWKNSYKTVEIWLITHDQGNQITEKDWSLAQTIDSLCTQ